MGIEISSESQIWAMYLIVKFVVATLKKKKNEVNFNTTVNIIQYTENIFISTCNHYKNYSIVHQLQLYHAIIKHWQT